MTPSSSTLPAPRTSDLALAAWQVVYDQREFWRNRVRAFFTFGLPLTFMVLFASLNSGGHVASRGGISYNAVFIPGILAYGLMMAVFANLAFNIARMRDEGVLKRVQGTPLPTWVFLAGRVGSAAVVGLTITVLALGLGAIAYDVPVPAGRLLGLAVAVLMGIACLTTLGIGVVRFIRNAETAPPIVNLLLLPLTFISGVWGPVDGEPAILHHIAEVFPLEHLAAWLQLCYDPRTTGLAFDGTQFAVLAVWTIAGVRMTQRFLRATMRV